MSTKNIRATIPIQYIHCGINNEKWRKKCLDIRQEWKWQRKSNYFTACTGIPTELTVKPEKKNASLNSENFHQTENVDIDCGPALTQTH